MQQVVLTLPDIPRVLTAISEWLACVYVISRYKKRVDGWILWIFSICVLVFQIAFLVTTGFIHGIMWVICMLIAVLSMGSFIYVTMECSLRVCFYRLAEAFIIAELTASMQWFVMCYLEVVMFVDKGSAMASSVIVVFGLIYGSLIAINRHIDHRLIPVITNRELHTIGSLSLVVFVSSNLSFLNSNTLLSGQNDLEIFRIRALVDLAGLIGIYAYRYLLMTQQGLREMEKMETMLKAQYQQYQMSKEAQDLINYKYHDLKHYITVLRNSKGSQPDGDRALLDRIAEEIKDYESQNKTGNDVLDTILTSKSIACQQNDISMTSVVDGALLNFMDVIDICSIFGNALDNAIEYEKEHVEQEKRMIHLTVIQQKNFVVIRIENYCEAIMTLEEKLPATSKEDNGLHGYGLRSIQHTVHKYKGEMNITTENGWFCLGILIPR